MPTTDVPAQVREVIAEEAKRWKVPKAWVVSPIAGRAPGAAEEARHAVVKRLCAMTGEDGARLYSQAQVGRWLGVSRQRTHQIVHGRGETASR